MISTDGISLFKSSTKDLWPVFLVLLNLPPAIRMSAQNVVLAGLWYGSKKPPMDLLIKPIMKKLKHLYMLGIGIETPHGLVTYRAKLELGIFDLPAKAAVLCAKQFNGKYGCSVCTNPGVYSMRRRNYLPTVYPERTHGAVLAAGRLAEAKQEAVRGIKGKSPLSTAINLVDGIPVDYMHAVLEGVTRCLLKYWFLPKNHSGAFYLGSKLKQIDKVLLRQQPPHELSRPPRSIEKHLKYFKASELRTWLLFYSLPLLVDNLPPLHFHHYALLVCAMHMLLQDEITPSQIDAAENMLSDFCKLLPELYGEISCTANAHLLLHLTKYVRLWGPLWTHSAFGFESKNGHLKRLIHGRGNIIPQLMFNVDVSQTLQLLHTKLVETESPETTNFLNSSSKLAPRSNMTEIGEHTYMVGHCLVKSPTSEESSAIGTEEATPFFSQLYKNQMLYHAANRFPNGQHGKRDSTMCVFVTEDRLQRFGRIMAFVKTSPPQALIRPFLQSSQTLLTQAGPPCRPSLALYKDVDLLNSFISIVEEVSTAPLVAVPVDNIQRKVILVKNELTSYVVKQPNNFEHH